MSNANKYRPTLKGDHDKPVFCFKANMIDLDHLKTIQPAKVKRRSELFKEEAFFYTFAGTFQLT